MTIAEVLREGKKQLEDAGVPEAELNAWYLFSYSFPVGGRPMERSAFFLRRDEEADRAGVERYRKFLCRRASRTPLEYIVRETEFMGLPFYVDERVLIPRQDTECLVEEALKCCRDKDVLDLCTGSGCIGISLAVLGGCRSVTLSDVSEGAVQVAEKNAALNRAAVTVVQSDLFQNVRGSFDQIVSNPPYIASFVVETLMPEVRDHEPREALDGKEDGLFFYRRILGNCRDFLRPEGTLHFEIGSDQGEAVGRLMEQAGFSQVEIKKDLAGLDRIVQGKRRIGGVS